MRRSNVFRTLLPLVAVVLSGCAASDKGFWADVKSNIRPPLASGSDASVQSETSSSPMVTTSATTLSSAPVPAYTFCASCLIDKSGKVLPLSTSLLGDLEKATQDGDALTFSGWGADTATGGPVQSVMLVSNGAVVAISAPTQPRPDISGQVKLYKNIFFGFEMKVPLAQIGPTAQIWLLGADGKVAAVDKVLRR